MIKGYGALPEAVQILVPDFDYPVHDLTSLSNEKIKGEAKLQIYILLVRAISNPKFKDKQTEILKAVKHFSDMEDQVSVLHRQPMIYKLVKNKGEVI